MIDRTSRVAQLTEVVDEGHDRPVAGGHRGRFGRDRQTRCAGVDQRVSVGHQRRASTGSVRARCRLAARRGRSLDRRGGDRGLGCGGGRCGHGRSDRFGRGGRCAGGQRGHVDLGRVLDVRGRLAELADRSCRATEPTSGSLPGPRMRSAMTRMMMSSGAPMLNGIVVGAPVAGGPLDRPAAGSGGYGSTGRRRAHSAAASATRSKGSRGAPVGRARRGAADAPRHVDEEPAAGSPTRRVDRRRDRARGPGRSRRPGPRPRARGTPGRGRWRGSRPARPARWPRRRARRFGPDPMSRRAVRRDDGAPRPGVPAASSAPTTRSCSSPAPGFDVRHRT